MSWIALLDINARKIANKPLAKLQLPLYTYSRLRQIVYGSQGWQKTKHKAVQSTAPSFFQACRRRKQLAKHNAKDDARPRAKAAYHRLNELEDDNSDDKDSAHENAELSDNENNSDSDNYNVHRPMNVFAL